MGIFSGFSGSARKRQHHGHGSSHYQQGGFGGMFGGMFGSSISSSKRRRMGGYGAPVPQQAPAAAPQGAPAAGGIDRKIVV